MIRLRHFHHVAQLQEGVTHAAGLRIMDGQILV